MSAANFFEFWDDPFWRSGRRFIIERQAEKKPPACVDNSSQIFRASFVFTSTIRPGAATAMIRPLPPESTAEKSGKSCQRRLVPRDRRSRALDDRPLRVLNGSGLPGEERHVIEELRRYSRPSELKNRSRIISHRVRSRGETIPASRECGSPPKGLYRTAAFSRSVGKAGVSSSKSHKLRI